MKKLVVTLVSVTILIFIFYLYLTTKKQDNISSKSRANPVSAIKEDTSSQTIALISTGDIGLVRDINYEIQKRHNPNYPFLKIGDYLKNADLTITNLEGPLINNCPIIPKLYKTNKGHFFAFYAQVFDIIVLTKWCDAD